MPTYHRASDGAPWWVNAIYRVGVPSAIALLLAWALVTRLSKGMDDIRGALEAHSSTTSTLKTMQDNEGEKLKEVDTHLEELVRLFRLNCVNSAIDAGSDKRECFK